MTDQTLLKEFGLRIRQLRLASGFSQEELAELTGFHRTYIGMVERGERNLSLSNIGQSFTITLSNNLTEKAGIDYLIAKETGFFYADSETRKKILELLELPKSFARAFDMIYIPRYAGKIVTDEIIEAHLDEILLVELKTTRKFLPENPKGFFFGATQNEFDFGERLGDKYRFCFVCLHPDSPSHKMLSVPQLEAIMRTKRIQYQINL